MSSKNPMYGITRIDLNREKSGTHGWEVRIQRKNDKDHKLFSDTKHGGKRKALEEAKKYRDKVCKSMPSWTRKEVAEMKRRVSETGIAGVRKIIQTVYRPYGDREYTYEFYLANWSPLPGVRKTKMFSVLKYGEDMAFSLAKQARAKGLREMKEVTPKHMRT